MTIVSDIPAKSVASAGADTRAHLGAADVAWPTIGLFGLLLIAGIANVWLAVSGAIPLWVGSIVSIIVFYYMEHINHEAVHYNISGRRSELKWLNELVGHIGDFWLFLPLPAFRAVHFAHHRATNDPDIDCDMWFARKTPLGVIASCSSLLVGYEIVLQKLYRRGLVDRKTMSEIYLTRALWLAAVIALFYLGYGLETFMLWIMPALLAMPLLAFLFAYVVHRPHESQERMKASNVYLGRHPLVQKALTGVMLFQNYHLVHHLHPRVPFYRYREAFDEVRPQLVKNDAPIRTL